MDSSYPLPVRFYAACALEQVLMNDSALQFVRPGLDYVLKCFLELMNEFDNDALVSAFENVMSMFVEEIRPFALDICKHMKETYKRCIAVNPEHNRGESVLAAGAALATIRRILDSVHKDVPVLVEVESMIYPVLLHTLTADGLDSLAEGVDCITIIIHHGYRQRPISAQLWKLYPQLLYVCGGADENTDGGFGLEHLAQVVVAVKNFIASDPAGVLRVGEGQELTNLQLLYHFINKIL